MSGCSHFQISDISLLTVDGKQSIRHKEMFIYIFLLGFNMFIGFN